MRWTLRSLLAVMVLMAVTLCLAVPMVWRAYCNAHITGCVNNLSHLWRMQREYAATHVGSGHGPIMRHERGGDFWLSLTRVQPPWIAPEHRAVLACPVHRAFSRPTDYRGPTFDVNLFADSDVVGADIDGNHGRGAGGNVLRKSGDVQCTSPDDPLWRAAAATTRE